MNAHSASWGKVVRICQAKVGILIGQHADDPAALSMSSC